MSPGIAVISFPGSNGDHDAQHAFGVDLGLPTTRVDYRETDLSRFGAIVLPGGFAYGDHLRCGAIARFAPVVASVKAFAERGGPVLGICNGFQVLTEVHLLPGALLRNGHLRFHCAPVHVRVETTASPWLSGLETGDVLELPVAHGEGSYFADAATLDALEADGRVCFRYSEPDGSISDAANFNGSARAIAGIRNAGGNVVGLMPHPERATDPTLGSSDGLRMLRSILSSLDLAI